MGVCFFREFLATLSPNVYRFVTLCIVYCDTPAENTAFENNQKKVSRKRGPSADEALLAVCCQCSTGAFGVKLMLLIRQNMFIHCTNRVLLLELGKLVYGEIILWCKNCILLDF